MKKSFKFVVLAFGLIMLALLKSYQFIFHPEWTEAEALWALWPYYLVTIGTVPISYIPDYFSPKPTE